MSRLWFEQALTAQGWQQAVELSLADGRIASVTCGANPAGADERHQIAIPGMANLHSHAFQRAMAGLAERSGSGADSFWTWREAMYGFVEALDPERMLAVAALAYAEMLEAGFTRVGEFHYVHHQADGTHHDSPAAMAEAIATAAGESGIRLTLLPVFYAHSDFGGAPPLPQQRRFLSDIDGYARLLEGSRAALADLDSAVLGVAPHSLRAVTPEELAALAGMVPNGPIHIHIAEQLREVEACLAWCGRRPVEWLLANAPVDDRWCLVHATHSEPEEIRSIARSGAVVGLCPITEANLGDGIFPAVELVENGGRFGIGSDSNVLISASEELRLLEYGQRLVRHGRTMLAGGPGRSTGGSLWTAAAAGGNQALGVGSGAIVEGAPADLVSLRIDEPAAAVAPLDGWIFAGARKAVDCVWRGGIKQVADGRHIDRERIEARYRSALRQMLA